MKRIVIQMMTVGMTAVAAVAETVEIGAECAGMSGFRVDWDRPILVAEDGVRKITDGIEKEWGAGVIWGGEQAGALAFDALNRTLLVRFPGAAEAIAGKLAEGYAIEKAEVVLPHLDDELWAGFRSPEDMYYMMTGWGADEAFRAVRPNWHAVAYALRKPWKADAHIGPTFNAAVNGKVYWKRWGASDVKEDRFATQFGPTEVSSYAPNGRMDVTELLTGAEYGKTLGERLRLVSDCGFAVSKWELYDHRYWQIHYEWTTSTGYRAITIGAPRLVVTLAPGKAQTVKLSPAADINAMAPQGVPTAKLLEPKEVEAMNAKFLGRPAWMPEWQYKRVQELATYGAGQGRVPPFYYTIDTAGRAATLKRTNPEMPIAELDYEVYKAWVDTLMARPVRLWAGFSQAADAVSLWRNHREAMPGPAVDRFLLDWNVWLQPDRKTAVNRQDWEGDLSGDLIHPQAEWSRKTGTTNPATRPGGMYYYYEKTGDWQGNRSFFRSGYTRSTSTEGFNHTAAGGALLMGQVIGSEDAMADGRWCLQNKLFWLWAYGQGGVGQVYIDHYYWAITLGNVKPFADYAERLDDQMLGWSMLTRNIESLAGAYHPNIRRVIGPSNRTMAGCVFGQMAGIYNVLHVLSPKGALTDAEAGNVPAISRYPERPVSVWEGNFPPSEAAAQSLSGPWADEWLTELVDEKPIPWSLVARKEFTDGEKRGGTWITTYFGENYGLGSILDSEEHRFHILGQWRRKAATPESTTDIGTIDARIGFNAQTPFVRGVAYHANNPLAALGAYRTYQHKNKAILLATPHMTIITNVTSGAFSIGGEAQPQEEITSVQLSAGLFSFEEGGPTWEIYVNDQKVESLPVTGQIGQVITIKDGVSYVAVRPLGGSPEVQKFRSSGVQNGEMTLTRGEPENPGNASPASIRAELIVNAYLRKGESVIADEEIDALRGAVCGFLIEMGDETEYGSFATFQAAMAKARCDVTFNDGRMKVAYASDDDHLVAEWSGKGDDEGLFTVNGASPYPASNDIWRDTTLTKMAKSGNLEKSGATIERTGGDENVLLLQTFPKQGIYVAMNPVPIYQGYTFTTPDGVKIAADGLLSMGRWAVKGDREIDIRYFAFDDKDAFKGADPAPRDQRATALLVTGMKEKPAVTLNGKPLTPVKEGDIWRIP
ncbi:MAG: hypothetical protein FWF84_03910, partial [Kiritimatiellaeota bacterium]|nr:hypothetical protein [Kiritimatiellota bacterium]